MATQTIALSSAEDGAVRVEIDWDDVNKVPLTLRQVNNTPRTSDPRAVESRVTFLNADGTEDTSKRFPVDGSFFRTAAGSTDAANLTPPVQSRFPLTVVNLRGRLVVANLSVETHFPVA